MVNIKKKILNHEIVISVPSSLSEAVSLCGSEEAALNIIIAHVTAHSTFGDIRADYLEALEEATGIKRKTKVAGTKKNGEPITEYDEREEEYSDRVLAEKGVEATAFTDLMNSAVEKNPFDPKPHERKPKAPRTPTKKDYATADAVIAAGKADTVASMLATGLNREVKADRESLARALMEDRLAEQERLANAQASKFGVTVA